MKNYLEKRISLLKEYKVQFCIKSLFNEIFNLYKKNFFFIFLNFLIYYILIKWFTKLIQNYTNLSLIFNNFNISIEKTKTLKELFLSS